jgi:hypothetical protein
LYKIIINSNKEHQQTASKAAQTAETEKTLNSFITKTRRATLRIKKKLAIHLDHEKSNSNTLDLETKELTNNNSSIKEENDHAEEKPDPNKTFLKVSLKSSNVRRISVNPFDVTNFYHLRKNKKKLEKQNLRSYSFSSITNLVRDSLFVDRHKISKNKFVGEKCMIFKSQTHNLIRSRSFEFKIGQKTRKEKYKMYNLTKNVVFFDQDKNGKL